MRFPILSAAFAALCLALPATAQKVQVFGGNGQRAASTVILFGENLMAGMSIVHGQPAWKAEYDTMLDKLKGKVNRLGKDWWTTFTTSIDCEIGGTKVPAGSYVLGLACDQDGKFTLAVMDAGKAMKAGLLPFGPQKWTPDFSIPLELKKDANEKVVELMKIELAVDKENPSTGTLTLSWGKHVLSAPMAISLAK